MSDGSTRRSALVVSSLGSFLTPFMGSALNVALPAIAREFAMDAVLLGWVATSYLLAAAVFLVPLGRIADIYGRKRVFAWGISIYTISCLLLTYSTSAMMLIVFRVLQGVGGAMIFGTGVAILISVFDIGERGRVLGINAAAVYTGLSLGPSVGGFLTQQFGWRGVFLFNVPLGLIVIWLVLWKLKGEWAEARGEKFDAVGSLVYGFTLIAIMYGFSLLPARSGMGLVLVGIVGLPLFAGWEMRVRSPILNISLFGTNTVFAFSNLAALVNYSATSATGFLLSLYLQHIKGLSAQGAGLILVSQPVVMAVLSPFVGRLSDRVEPRIVASVGMALTVVGLCLLIFLDEETALWFVTASLILLGLGFAFFSAPNTNAVMSSVEKRYYGVASGTLATMRLTGQALSMGIVMLIFAVYMGRVQIAPEHYSSLLSSIRIACTIFAALCFGGIFASLARGKVR